MEKRKFIRISSDFFVWYQTINEEDISFGKTSSKNISAGGIRLEMEEPEEIGTCLLMKFQIPDYDEKIVAKGKVVWVHELDNQKHELGIEFYEISNEDMQAINLLSDKES